MGVVAKVILGALTWFLLCNAALGDSNCKLIQNAEWPVRVDKGHLIVDASINGRHVDAAIQIGSPTSAMMRSAASRLDIRTDYANREASGAVRDRFVDYAVIDELRIGQTTQKDLRVYVVDGKDFGDAALVVGYDFFRRWDIELDLANHAVRLFTVQDCEGKTLAYWARGAAIEVPLNPNDSSANPSPSIGVQINKQRVFAYLNSWGTASTVSKQLANRLHPHQSESTQDLVEFDTFTIGGETIHNPKFKQINMSDEYFALGLDFMLAHRIFIAHSQQRMYFTYVGGPVFNPPPSAPTAPTRSN